MPTYEYACTDCGERVEVFQRIADAPLEVCELCGGRMRKLFHPVGISFKGSGFYATDNRGKKPSSAPSEKKASEKKAPSEGKGPETPKEKSA